MCPLLSVNKFNFSFLPCAVSPVVASPSILNLLSQDTLGLPSRFTESPFLVPFVDFFLPYLTPCFYYVG